MSILVVLVPISVLLLGLAIAAFVWAVRRGQFEQLDSAALDILAEDRDPAADAADRDADAASSGEAQDGDDHHDGDGQGDRAARSEPDRGAAERN